MEWYKDLDLDGVIKMKLTLEEALKLHREMWGDMQRELGDCPKGSDRVNFKINWCEERFPEQSIACCCFLCEFDEQYCPQHNMCSNCPIVWESLSANGIDTCCSSYKGLGEIYKSAPISEILALPEREFKDV